MSSPLPSTSIWCGRFYLGQDTLELELNENRAHLLFDHTIKGFLIDPFIFSVPGMQESSVSRIQQGVPTVFEWALLR